MLSSCFRFPLLPCPQSKFQLTLLYIVLHRWFNNLVYFLTGSNIYTNEIVFSSYYTQRRIFCSSVTNLLFRIILPNAFIDGNTGNCEECFVPKRNIHTPRYRTVIPDTLSMAIRDIFTLRTALSCLTISMCHHNVTRWGSALPSLNI